MNVKVIMSIARMDVSGNRFPGGKAIVVRVINGFC